MVGAQAKGCDVLLAQAHPPSPVEAMVQLQGLSLRQEREDKAQGGAGEGVGVVLGALPRQDTLNGLDARRGPMKGVARDPTAAHHAGQDELLGLRPARER